MRDDKMIDSVSARASTCLTCANEDLSRMVARWLSRRGSGEILPPLETMHRQLFSKVGSISLTSLRRHIANCLRLDHRTGKAL